TSSYDSLDSLRLMDGVVSVYMPDFKFWTAERARRYLKRGDYPEVARGTEAILRWIAEELGPGTYVNLMAQYYPSGRVGPEFQELDRHVHREEYEAAVA